MPHRHSHRSSEYNSHNPQSRDHTGESSPRLRAVTHTTGTAPQTSESAAPRWEQRHRPPSQREPLYREHHAPHPEEPGEQHWNRVASESAAHQAPQWSRSDLEDLAHETMARRGRKLSRRRARVLAARAQRRHVEARKIQSEPKRKRRPLWHLFRAIAVSLFLVALFELGAAALTSPRFAVQDISSDPVQVVPEAAIEQVKASLIGQNFFRADTNLGAEQLMHLPPVQSVSVHRQLDWPPRLHLSIIERQPFARVDAGDNQWLVVDQEGVPFRPATVEDNNLYAVSSRAIKPSIGKKLHAEQWTPVVEFAQTLQQDAEQGHDWALRAIYFDEHGFASLRLAESGASQERLLVHLGTGPWHKKLQRTRQALAWLQSKGVQAETLNLISAKRLVWTPRLPKVNENPVGTDASTTDQPT